jgi:hypothetical protein
MAEPTIMNSKQLVSAALMDTNEIMLKLYDDPPFVHALMARREEYAFAYAIPTP